LARVPSTPPTFALNPRPELRATAGKPALRFQPAVWNQPCEMPFPGWPAPARHASRDATRTRDYCYRQSRATTARQ